MFKLTIGLLLTLSSISYAQVDKIVVYKKQREMNFYEGDKIVKSYNIRLSILLNSPIHKMGKKRLKGDKRTPEGHYKIIKKRRNTNYTKSLLLNYPNKKDIEWGKENGLSKRKLGNNILIHGPRTRPAPSVIHFAKKFGIGEESVDAWAKKYFYPFFDWTRGCIAVSQDEMDEIFELIEVGTPIIIYRSKPIAGQQATSSGYYGTQPSRPSQPSYIYGNSPLRPN